LTHQQVYKGNSAVGAVGARGKLAQEMKNADFKNRNFVKDLVQSLQGGPGHTGLKWDDGTGEKKAGENKML
jgi:hypothetical protein